MYLILRALRLLIYDNHDNKIDIKLSDSNIIEAIKIIIRSSMIYKHAINYR